MNHKEYIVPIGEEAKEFDEMFIGMIRRQPELVRCKDCANYHEGKFCILTKFPCRDRDYCSWAEKEEE